MKVACVCATLMALFMVTGCESELRYTRQLRKVTIETEPEGALVYQINPVTDERIFLGTTPLKEQTVFVPVDIASLGPQTSEYAARSQLEMVQVVVEKEGYKTFMSNLATKRAETARHRIYLERK